MDFLAQDIIPYILFYKYIAIFIVSFLAALMVPLPAGIILMTASAFASDGYLNIGIIILISTIANILGDNIVYWISYFYGEKTLTFFGFRRVLKSRSFQTIEQKFKDHPGVIIFTSRFEFLSTLSVNILSGIGRIQYSSYLLYEITGSIMQVSFYAFIGFFFGYNWEVIYDIMGRSFLSIIFILILLTMIYRKRIFYFNTKE